MIANIKNQCDIKAIKKYVTYCITPQAKNAKAYQESGVHRVMASIAPCGNLTPNLIDDWANQVEEWTQISRGDKLRSTTYRSLVGVIAFSSKDNITPGQAVALVKNIVEHEMGGGSRQGIFIAHQDGDEGNIHVHFAAPSVDDKGQYFVGPTGKGALFRQFEAAMEAAETRNNFEKVTQRKYADEKLKKHAADRRASGAVPDAKASDKRSIKISAKNSVAYQKEKRTNVPTPDTFIRDKLTQIHKVATGFPDFLRLCYLNNIRVQPRFDKEKIKGISFGLDDMRHPIEHATPGYKLGQFFKWEALSTHLKYDRERDYPHLQQARQRCDAIKKGVEPPPQTWWVAPAKAAAVAEPQSNFVNDDEINYVELQNDMIEVDYTLGCDPTKPDDRQSGRGYDNGIGYGG